MTNGLKLPWKTENVKAIFRLIKALSRKHYAIMRDFKKYDVWDISHKFVLKIYNLIEQIPEMEKYQLVSQMQRAAYSIPSNFSEGCGRDSDKDFNRFIQISLGSAHELEYFILLSKDLNYIPEEQYIELTEEINEIKRKLYNLSKKLKA